MQHDYILEISQNYTMTIHSITFSDCLGPTGSITHLHLGRSACGASSARCFPVTWHRAGHRHGWGIWPKRQEAHVAGAPWVDPAGHAVTGCPQVLEPEVGMFILLRAAKQL